MKIPHILALGAMVALTACSTSSTPHPRLAATAACSQLPDTRAAVQNLYQPGRLYAAKPIREKQFLARALQPERTVGAEMSLHAEEGMTRQYVERVLRCHAANGTAVHPNDPLHPSTGRVTQLDVRSAGDSLAVRVVGDSPRAGREIWQRARSLAESGTHVTVEQIGAAGPTAAF
jgi:hypothetical protein